MSTQITTASRPVAALDAEGGAGIETRDGGRRGRAVTKLFVFAALVAASIMLTVPVTASADALVSNPGNGQDCAFFVAGKVYRGSGTEVITPTGRVNLSCHLSLESGAAVERPTTTTIGNCELLETPSGQARASCHFQL